MPSPSSKPTSNRSRSTRPEERICPCCGGLRPFQFVFAKWGFDILRCHDCGLGQTLVPPDFDPTSIYTEQYFQGGHRDGYADYRGSEQVLRNDFRRTVQWIRKAGVQNGTLLEIGCAFGFFLKEAEPFYQCHGIEITPEAVAYCQSRNLRVTSQTPEEVCQALGKGFDVVVMLDVIEHLMNPGTLVEQLQRTIRPNGIIALTTGDWNSFYSRLAGPKWRLLTPPQHLFFFTLEALERLFRRCGFEIITFDHPWKFVPVGLAAYQVSRRVGFSFRQGELLNRVGIPVNLFDVVRVIAKRTPS